jgi:hypothetical protein
VAENPDAIRREIEDTRDEMAETIDALEYKADVKSRARERVTELRGTVAERADAMLSSVRGTAQRVGDGMMGAARVDASSPVERSTTDVTGRARIGIEQGRRLAEDNPILLAIGAAAAGFLFGMAIPSGRRGKARRRGVGE